MNTIDISSKAMLAALHVSLPGNYRKDNETTARVKRAESLGDDSGKWDRQLYPKTALKPLQQLQGDCRTFHYSQTLVYPEDGWCILTARRHLTYTDYMRNQKQVFDSHKARTRLAYERSGNNIDS